MKTILVFRATRGSSDCKIWLRENFLKKIWSLSLAFVSSKVECRFFRRSTILVSEIQFRNFLFRLQSQSVAVFPSLIEPLGIMERC